MTTATRTILAQRLPLLGDRCNHRKRLAVFCNASRFWCSLKRAAPAGKQLAGSSTRIWGCVSHRMVLYSACCERKKAYAQLVELAAAVGGWCICNSLCRRERRAVDRRQRLVDVKNFGVDLADSVGSSAGGGGTKCQEKGG